jgi:hypothetical protein
MKFELGNVVQLEGLLHFFNNLIGINNNYTAQNTVWLIVTNARELL